MTDSSSTIDLRQYWRVLRFRKFSLIIPVIFLAALALLYAKTQPRQYTAQATVRVDSLVTPFPSGSLQANLPDMPTEQQTAASAAVASRVRSKITNPPSVTDLLKHLKVTAASSGNTLVISYTSSSPLVAARYAEKFAEAYLRYRNSPLSSLIFTVKANISQLKGGIPTDGTIQRKVDVARLQAAGALLQQLETAVLISAGKVISPATRPTTPSSPKTSRDLAIGLAAGLVVGVCLALTREALDNKIRTREDLEARLRVPVLGVIPRLGRGSQDGALATLSEPRSATSDGYRVAATTLQFLAARDNLTVIMFTAPSPGPQSTVTTANLGVALAQAGQRVILVSADMRGPILHQQFGLSNEFGLSTARHEGRDAKTLVQETAVPNLHVLASGPEPRNPAALLASPITGEVLASLRSVKPDFILIAAPTVLATPDALVLAPRVDGTVIVWNGADSDPSALMEGQGRLATVGANILGAIYSFDRPKSVIATAPRTYDVDEHEVSASVRRRIDLATGSNSWVEAGGTTDHTAPGPRITQ
jgi:capsular exopolysaccharide synthesis family protein